MVGLGANAADAAIAADIAQSWAATLLRAEAIGAFAPLGEADTFDMEYWSLEQAKLGRTRERRLERRVVVVTGGGGVIGAAVARAFAAEGAEVAILERDADAGAATAASIGRHALFHPCDQYYGGSRGRRASSRAACASWFRRVVDHCRLERWCSGSTGEPSTDLPSETLQASFELNFFAHQSVARAAVAIMRAQAMGGALLFNVSKQAVNPGPDFGAYGTAKAALLALMRQYAIELGGEGIRSSAVNADRVRSGLLTTAMIEDRARARGLTAEAYMAGNLLRREVTAEDVAQAFVFAALMEGATGAVLSVDGGNVAAMMR